MYIHPDLAGRVAKDHQRELLREAAVARQHGLARVDQLSLSMRVRRRVSALLHRLGSSVQPRDAGLAQRPNAAGRRVDNVSAPVSGA